ncbi:MAG: hypothetical protein P8X94_07950, partial [Woeseiaceae bacterium]
MPIGLYVAEIDIGQFQRDRKGTRRHKPQSGMPAIRVFHRPKLTIVSVSNALNSYPLSCSGRPFPNLRGRDRATKSNPNRGVPQMNQFQKTFRWAWSILMVCALAFAMGGCEGDDGAEGPIGPVGPVGPPGPPGTDLTDDPVANAIEAAQIESCSTCHAGVGGGHQAIYDAYSDDSAFVLTFTDFTVTPNGGLFDVELEFTITKDGMPFEDFADLDQQRFYATRYRAQTGEYLDGNTQINDSTVMTAPGTYVRSEAGLSFDPTVNGQVYGYIAQGALFEHDSPTSEGLGSHVHLYDDVASAALAWGNASATGPNPYESAANVSGCENCHGSPYLKHGYRAA